MTEKRDQHYFVMALIPLHTPRIFILVFLPSSLLRDPLPIFYSLFPFWFLCNLFWFQTQMSSILHVWIMDNDNALSPISCLIWIYGISISPLVLIACTPNPTQPNPSLHLHSICLYQEYNQYFSKTRNYLIEFPHKIIIVFVFLLIMQFIPYSLSLYIPSPFCLWRLRIQTVSVPQHNLCNTVSVRELKCG